MNWGEKYEVKATSYTSIYNRVDFKCIQENEHIKSTPTFNKMLIYLEAIKDVRGLKNKAYQEVFQSPSNESFHC